MPERPAPDQRVETLDSLDSADLLRQEKLPDAAEADHTNSYDAGSLGDGAAAFSRDGGAAAASTATTAASTTWRRRRARCASI